MCWRSSPDRERPMVRLKRSTAGLNICAGLLWGSVTSPTTSPGVCSSPVASDRFYTLNYDEPDNPLQPASTAPKNPHTKFPPLTWELIRQFRTELTNADYDDGPRS